MKQLILTGMVLLMAACGGAPETKTAKKADIVTARDMAEQKLAETELLKDSLEGALQTVAQQETAMAAFVMEHATALAADAPEVEELNRLRRQVVDLKNKIGLCDGQIRLLKRDLGMDKP